MVVPQLKKHKYFVTRRLRLTFDLSYYKLSPLKVAPPGLSIATVHGPPTVYKRGQGLGFRHKWLAGLVSRVCMAKLDSRVCMAGLVSRVCPGGPNTAQWIVRGDHNLGGPSTA